MTTSLDVGASLSRIELTPGNMRREFRVGDGMTQSVTIGQLPGPMGFYLVAIIAPRRDVPALKDCPDTIIPLHMAESFDVMR